MLRIHNTLSKQVEEFKAIEKGKVLLYTCGPTIYSFMTVGNWRTFVFEDVLRRVLEFDDFSVNHVMNVTDVGHLTGDNVGDADLGEDRMEKAAKRENKTAWDIAEYYLKDFLESRDKLNILSPTSLPRATDNIKEQIELTEKLFENGLAYTTRQGVYFDVSKFPSYGKLGGQKLIDKRVATRDELVEDPEKRNPFDFALWKFTPSGEKRQMEWESPWGKGFPGWHIECSAMSMKYLGETLDIHAGGVDHIAIHHTNEIAQSEGATGKTFSSYWMHGEFLTVDGGRMGKSLGNAYTLQDVEAKGFEPLALRYFYFGAHYRKVLNFTWEALDAAQNALNRLRHKILELNVDPGEIDGGYRAKFLGAVNEDLNMPQALAVVWEMLEDKNLDDGVKLATVLDFDKVLGLKLSEEKADDEIPVEVGRLMDERERFREEEKFDEADQVREKIEQMGYTVKDSPEGSRVVKK